MIHKTVRILETNTTDFPDSNEYVGTIHYPQPSPVTKFRASENINTGELTVLDMWFGLLPASMTSDIKQLIPLCGDYVPVFN